jgi:hypothetical protein
MENVGILYGNLEFVTAIWYILWSFGNFEAIWYIFPRFGILCKEKSGNPVSQQKLPGRSLTIDQRYSVPKWIYLLKPVLENSRRRDVQNQQLFGAGLPDFSRHKIPKREKYTK